VRDVTSQFRKMTISGFSLDFASLYLFGQHLIAVKQVVNMVRPFLSAFELLPSSCHGKSRLLLNGFS
jgi:hypothetical protein